MKNRITAAAMAGLLCCAPVMANAATCRAATAAQTGSDTGYKAAKTASDAWSKREIQISDQMNDCLLGVKNVAINLPHFPSLQDIVNRATEQLCRDMTDKINSVLPDSIDPWQSYNG